MGNKLSHNQRKIYQAVIIIWLILFVIVVSWIVVFDLQRAKALFTENASLQYQQSNGRVHIIESILEGFAAMVSVSREDKNKEIFDLDQVIQDVINFLEWEVQESGVTIELRRGGQMHKVKADKIQIEQVLVNLVWNSLEAIGHAKIANGRVVIQTRLLPNDLIEVTVTDNGPGIDAAMADKVFEQFQTSKEKGMGIGLSLSRTIIEEVHGGKLWLDKDHQNGALFGFELPVFQCPDQGNGSVENSKSELA